MSNKKILSENAECLLEFELAPVLCTQPCPLAVRGGRWCLIFTAAPPPVLCTQPCPLAVRGGRRCLIFVCSSKKTRVDILRKRGDMKAKKTSSRVRRTAKKMHEGCRTAKKTRARLKMAFS